MPVTRIAGSEGPGDRWPGQTGLDMRVIRDVNRIVVINEAIPERWEEDREYYEEHQNTSQSHPEISSMHRVSRFPISLDLLPH